MLCAGSIRAKNVKNVLLWNLLDSCGGGLSFWACGYAFAYGGDDISKGKTFIGNTDFFLRNEGVDYEAWFFQFAFACALSSIVAGTVAERCKMTAYLCYSVFLVGFVYPVVSTGTLTMASTGEISQVSLNHILCIFLFSTGCPCFLVRQWISLSHYRRSTMGKRRH